MDFTDIYFYDGEVDQCALCEGTLYIDHPNERFIFIDGLGRVCPACDEQDLSYPSDDTESMM